jgi:hypothetical protein
MNDEPNISVFSRNRLLSSLAFSCASQSSKIAPFARLDGTTIRVFSLTDSYRRKAALYTRGSLVSYEQNPRLYESVYLLMSLVGLFMVFVFLVVNFLH